ncbi:MAG TPA: outer membrane beta-barrel protein [Chthoniobacterales bacterium]|nr:outer membrane beta-barrel protein [Chthoniobacterales bacterium]
MQRLILLLTALVIGQAAPAAERWGFFPIEESDWILLMRPYLGIGASCIHHTGYAPNRALSAEEWQFGGEAFGGFMVTPALNLEIAYHYLNESPLRPERFGATEQSHAIAGSAMLFSKKLRSPWKTGFHRWFLRGGMAFKQITEDSEDGRETEDGLAGVFGAGIELDFNKYLFGRFEYEHLFKVGTNRVVNVRHTPISASLGIRF